MIKKFPFLALMFLCFFAAKESWAVNIAAFGDSITRGYPYYTYDANGIPNNGGYVPSLQSQLNAVDWGSGSSVTVYNWGHPGEHVVHEGQPRLTAQLPFNGADVVLLQEGTNDLSLGWYGPTTVSNTLNAMVLETIADGLVPVIGTLLPRYDHLVSDTDVRTVNDNIRINAAVSGTDVADFYFANSNWSAYMTDGLHPNTTGYGLMADVWFDTLVRYKERIDAEARAKTAGAMAAVNYLLLLSD